MNHSPILPILIAGFIGGSALTQTNPKELTTSVISRAFTRLNNHTASADTNHRQSRLNSHTASANTQSRLNSHTTSTDTNHQQSRLPRHPSSLAPLIQAIITVESGGNPKATRLEPTLAKRYPKPLATSYGQMQVLGLHTLEGEACSDMSLSDLLTTDKNILCGSRILSQHLTRYQDRTKALIAWNGGTGCFSSKKCLDQAKKYASRVLSSIIN